MTIAINYKQSYLRMSSKSQQSRMLDKHKLQSKSSRICIVLFFLNLSFFFATNYLSTYDYNADEDESFVIYRLRQKVTQSASAATNVQKTAFQGKEFSAVPSVLPRLYSSR